MRFSPLAFLGGLSVCTRALAQESDPVKLLAGGNAELLLYGAAPLVGAAAAIGLVRQFRKWRAGPGQVPVEMSLWGRVPQIGLLVTLVSGLLLTAYFTRATKDKVESDSRADFNRQVDDADHRIREQFDRLLSPLRGIRATIASSDYLTRSEFRSWVESRDLAREMLGVRGLGLIERVPRNRLGAFTATQRKDGAPDFAVRTSGNSPDLWVTKYIEPLVINRAAVGFDVGSEPARRAAVETAMREGRPALTGRLTLVQDGQHRPGFLLLMPMYSTGSTPPAEEDRVRTCTGFSFAPVVLSELMATDYSETQELTGIQIFLGDEISPASMVYDSNYLAGEVGVDGQINVSLPHLFRVDRRMLIHGQLFQLRVYSTRLFEQTVDLGAPQRTALNGSVLSVLAAFVIWLLLAGRQRAEGLARSMTADLNRLALVAQKTTNAVVITDLARRITWVNDAFTRITGYSMQEAIGTDPGHLLQCERTDPATARAISHALERGEGCKVVILNRHKDGHDFWFDLDIQSLKNERGEVTGFMAIEIDVTEQVEANEALAYEKQRVDNILVGSNAGTWELNMLTNEVRYNDRWCTMIGYSKEEVDADVQHFWEKHVHPDDLVRANNALSLCFNGMSKDYSVDMRMTTKRGEQVWILSRARVTSYDAQGRPEWLVGIQTDITESKRVEQSLRNMEAFLDRAGRVAGIGAWEVDLRTQTIVWSDRTCDIHGVEPGFSPTLEQALSYYPPDARVQVQNAIARAQQTSSSWDLTTPFVNARGESLWVRSAGEVEFDDTGAVRLVGALQDVTRAKQAEMQVQRSGEILRGAIEAINEPFVLFDPDDRLVLCNEKYREINAVCADLIVPGATFESIIRGGTERGLMAASQGREEEWIAERMAIHRAANTALEQKMSDGRWVKVVERRMPDGHIVGFRVDITELKNANEAAVAANVALAKTTATLQSVLDSAVDVVIVATNLDRAVTVFNKGAELLTGYSADEMLGRRRLGVLFEQSQLGVLAETMELVLGRSPSPDELFAELVTRGGQNDWNFVRKDGSRFVANLVISPMLDDAGELIGHLGIAYDVTSQKEYEATLQEARLAAEQSSVSKSQFLANMSHEIRTPMNAILGMLKLLHNTPLNDRQRDYADKTEGAAKSLLGILNDILDFSKVEAGKMQLDPEPFVVDELLTDLSVILSSNLGGKNVDLLFDVDPQMPRMLVGDAMRLKQVLINLGGNAVKFTAQGQVVIRWNVVALHPEQVRIEIAVVDSGIGIAPENLARIFEGFSQAEANTTRRFGGTGLGLAISQRLVQLMGGQLALESALGEGSTFRFSIALPVAHSEVPSTLPPGAARPALHTLLVDDNPVALEASAGLMRSLGWDVELAGSGAQALEKVALRLQRQAPALDAIFVDWQMPGMDGWETLRNVRRLYDGSEAPALMLISGQGRDAMAERTGREQELINGFLVKPLTVTMFQHAWDHARDTPQIRSESKDGEGPGTGVALQRLGGMRLLVVEDNPINQQVARELLEAEGARVQLADNGRLGVDAIANAKPQFDAVLMDLQMPVMDGLSAAKAIRLVLGLTQLPVIAMTANAMASDREACLAVGMNDHVGKPFDLDDLVRVLVHHTAWVPHAVQVAMTTATQPADQTEIVWPTGMDGAAALARMGGNRSLLGKTMRSFAQDAAGLVDRAQHCLDAGDPQAAQRELHAAKGLAGTLGLNALSALAALAEAALKKIANGDAVAEVPNLLEQVRVEVLRVVPQMDAVATQLVPPVQPQSEPVSETDWAGPLRELLEALQQSDMQSMELHAALRQSCSAAQAEAMEPLDAAVAELDFEQAAVECAKLVTGLTQ